MTTFRRTTEVPPPPGHGVHGYAPFNVGTPLSDTKTSFRPVNAGTLLEIMGYTTAGLSDIGVSDDEVAIRIFIWHTWLRRMNSWMRDNEAQYLAIMRLADSETAIPKNEYFLGGVSSLTAQSNTAETAALGPLLPGDKGTFINALGKGAAKTDGAGKAVAKTLTRFLQDVDKVATHLAPSNRSTSATAAGENNIYVQQVKSAVQPWQDAFQGSVIKFPMNPVPNNSGALPAASVAVTPMTSIAAAPSLPIAISTPVTAVPVSAVPATAVQVSASSAAGLFTSSPVYTTVNPSAATSKDLVLSFIPQITGYAQQLLERVKRLPMWAHVLLFALLFAIVVKGHVRTSKSARSPTIPSYANTGSISKFTIPPVDPFV